MRPRILFASAAICCAVGLSGCVRQGDGADSHVASASTGYCATFKTSSGAGAQNTPIGDPAAAVDDCIHRWAYVLSRGHDPADVVAHATMEACSTALASWNQQGMSTAQPDQIDAPPRYARRGQASDQSANPMAQRMGMVNAKALFYVVQARAGNCELPPASSLVTPPNPS
jgi:hypothetical protein